MRFNERQLVQLSLEEGDLEGRLNYKKVPIIKQNSHVSQSGYKERWFKIKSNLLFYFKLNEVGRIEAEPAGVFVLENTNVKCELSTGTFAFSITFNDDPERKHIFCARSEDNVKQWVSMLKQANYERMRSQLVILQSKIKEKTGKDPLLTYPYNKGVVRDVQTFRNSIGVRPSTSKYPIRAAPPPPPLVDNLIEL